MLQELRYCCFGMSAPSSLHSAEVLLDAYWEWIDDEILGLLFDPASESPLITESHSRGDILPLLRTKIGAHERVLTHGPQDASILGEWYSVIANAE